MKIKLLVIAHPIFLTMPVLFLWTYSLCNILPICTVNTFLHSFGLSFYCSKAVNPTGIITDYYVTWIWLVAFMIWAYSFVNGDPINSSDEMLIFLL